MPIARLPLVVLGALAVVNGVIWSAVFDEQSRTLRVAFLDVGQGDAVYVEAPSGEQLLIDGSAGSQVVRQLSRQMPFYDRSVDVVLSSHPDRDHIGGLPAVLDRFHIDHIVRTAAENDTGAYRAYRQRIRSADARAVRARRGMRIWLGERTVLTVHFPDRAVQGMETNAQSVVAKLTYGDTSFLFTGDAPDAIERYVAAIDQRALASDVLKVGHHGSDTSTTNAFLSAVQPKHAVISAGADNPHGHPHEAVLEQLRRIDAQVHGTYRDGTVVFESNGRSVKRID